MGLSNSQYDSIINKYNSRRLSHELEQVEHKKEIYAKCSRIQEIDDEIASLSAKQARARILNQEVSRVQYLNTLSLLAEEKKNLLLANGYPTDYMELKYDCPICKDTGVHENQRCVCYKRAITQLLYDSSGLKNILDLENFDSFDISYFPQSFIHVIGNKEFNSYENMLSILESCKEYIENFDNEKGNMIFTGDAGTGKSFMTHCIAKELMDRGFSVVYQTASQFFDNLAVKQFHFSEDTVNDSLIEFYTDADLLIIDDLGSELTNSFTNSRLFECINERINKGVGTIISTNESLSNLRDTYSDRIYSRLIGNYTVLPFFSPDIRKEQKRRNR